MHNTVSVSPQRRSPPKDPILRGALEDRPDSTQLNNTLVRAAFDAYKLSCYCADSHDHMFQIPEWRTDL